MSHPLPQTGRLAADDLIIDLDRRRISRDGAVLELTALSYDLFIALMRAHPDPLDGETLARDIWQVDHVSDETISQRIALLRKALGDQARDPRYIRTVRHKGYAFVPEPRALDAMTAPAPEMTAHDAHARTALRPGRILAGLALTAGALALVIAGLMLWPRAEEAADTPPPMARDLDRDIPLERARALMRLHQPRETDMAISLLNDLVARRPDDAAARLQLSFALTTRVTKFEARPDDIRRAEALARTLLEEGYEEATAWHALGYALDAQARMDEALAAYQQAYTLDPQDYAAMSSAAYLLRVRGRFYEALSLEARALQSGEATLYAPTQIAGVLSLLDHPAQDIWWPRALADSGGTSVALAERLEADLRQGEAARVLERLARQPDSLTSLPRLQRLHGLALMQTGDRDAALDALAEAGFTAQLDHAALALMIDADVAIIDWESALATAQSEGQISPDFRVRLAAIEAQTGDLEAAANHLAIAIDLGWRDSRWIEEIGFYAPLIAAPSWPPLRDRMQRERDAQRRLIETAPETRALLEG